MHLAPPVAANLSSLGWTPGDAPVRATTAPAARGHNIAVVAPPSPAWAGPALAGAVSRLATEGGRLLAVCPPEAVREWAAALAALAAGAQVRLAGAQGPARAARLLHDDAADLLVASPDTVLELLARSALRTDSLTAVALLWPDSWATGERLAPIMQDLPKEAQRLIVGTESGGVAALVERHARKAVVWAVAEAEGTAGPVRTVAVSWARRIGAVAELVDLLDPPRLTLWAVDRRLESAIAATLGASGTGAVFLTRPPETSAGTIICLDLPDPATLRALLEAGDVILLVPAGTDLWVPSLAAPRRPIPLPGPVGAAAEEIRRRRGAIAAAVEAGEFVEASLVLGPLLERYEAPAVAAALYTLWTRREAAPAPAPEAAGGQLAKVWIGIGRRDEVGPNELVAFLTREIGLHKGTIGRIEVRESYTLVEVPAAEAERIAGAVSGKTLKRRRLASRVDRGPAPGGRPGRPSGARQGS
jgi:ATP-dependent RNA helicase DeaD